MAGKAHLAEAFRWSTAAEVELVEVLASGLGMGGPVFVAAAAGQLPLGLTVSLGGMAMSGVAIGQSARAQVRSLALAFAPMLVAATAASLAAGQVEGHGAMSDAMIVLLAGLAAMIGNFSRALAVASVRFVLFLIISVSATQTAPNRLGFLVLVTLGAMWAAALSLSLGALVRSHRRLGPGADRVAAPAWTLAQRYGRWKQSLAHLSGWQYALRLVLCLAVAGVARWALPTHHLYWIAITIALLTQRQLEIFPVRTTQRAIGTALGAVGASLLLAFRPPAWDIAIGIGLLAGFRPLLRARNYLAYSAIMTPLIILIMEAGRPVAASVLIDRLVATLVGAALTIAANLIVCKWLGETAYAENHSGRTAKEPPRGSGPQTSSL
ncbi:MAG: FUSC family protein [Beijerinckiaceae bacterium]